MLETAGSITPELSAKRLYVSVGQDGYNPTNLGAVYTPENLARWVAFQMARYLPCRKTQVILDPACGDGALLAASSEGLAPDVRLVGADFDRTALKKAKERLSRTARLLNIDSLHPASDTDVWMAWKTLLGRRRITGVIANPPWGADLQFPRSRFKELGYRVAQGQFDSFDLFTELCIRIVPDNTILAMILPDSIFLPEHEVLRRLILSTTKIHVIARLGEGFFPNVFRGTAVLVLQKGSAHESHMVECFRLNKEWRDRIFTGEASITEAQRELTHSVPQTRFEQDGYARFDIDVSRSDETAVRTMQEAGGAWTRWFKSGRGIELSKSGRVVVCPNCQRSYPVPREGDVYVCKACRCRFAIADYQQEITRPIDRAQEGYAPLIAGEDVDRYRSFPSRAIRVGVDGINYKTPEQFSSRKLLIRKTGVGLKAAIDETGAYTTQVVFHYYIPKEYDTPPFLLDYVQGVLCSRVLYAYHLKRIGENEWRSHPYITQRVISELPVPVLQGGTWQWAQGKAIADAVNRRRPFGDAHNHDSDIAIDCLVAGLFGLSREDCAWVIRVLQDAQALEPVRTLRLADPSLLQPIRMA